MYKRHKSGDTQRDGYWLYGRQPVLHALRNPKRDCQSLLLTENARQFLSSQGMRVEQLKVSHQIVTNEAIQMLVPHGAVHQGIALKTKPLAPVYLREILSSLGRSNHNNEKSCSIIVVCDQITDPHNFGAILRSAAAFGVDAVVITERHQAHESAIVAKAAAGMLEVVPIVEVVNLADALRVLKEHSYWVIGLDAAAQSDIKALKQFEAIALVLGSEGDGMRPLTTKHCDMLVSIKMTPAAESLNVSNSAAIALYSLYQD